MLWFLGSLAAAPARADAPAGPAHDWSLSTRASADADHAAGSGSQGALTVALDGMARRESPSFLGATGGALRLTAGGPASGLGATHWSRLRVHLGHAADDEVEVAVHTLAVRHRLDWHGTPALSSPRTLWRRPYTSVSGGLSARMLGLSVSSWTADIFGLAVDAGQVRQRDAALTAVQNQVSVEFAAFGVRGSRRNGPDYAFDCLAMTARAVSAGGAWSSAGSMDWVRLEGMRFAKTVFGDFSIGMAGTNVMYIGPPEHAGEPGVAPAMHEEQHPLASITAVRGRVQGTRGPVTVAVAGHRDVHLTFDGQPALEQRLASEVSWTGSEHAVTVEAFAARTELWPDGDQRERDVTGGVSGTWQRALDHGWFLDLSVEAARSFYASLAGAAQPEAGLGARATAQLSRRFGALP